MGQTQHLDGVHVRGAKLYFFQSHVDFEHGWMAGHGETERCVQYV